jgi:predicted regulator of Ras-like GTPase activity (Roadblock/LC7/MglB family)
MGLKDTLKDIPEKVGGGIGALLMGYDGIPIEEYILGSDIDIQLLSVEYVNVMKEVKRSVEVLKTGALEEILISTEQSKIIIRTVCEDYFVMLILNSEGNYGKGRYLLKLESPNLRDELM